MAKKAISLVDKDINLIELRWYNREKVNLIMNAVDLLLVTSHSETGPLVVKEAMACNCPIVSTDVGDVKSIIGGTEGCYITTYDPEDVAYKIKRALDFGKRTNGREKIKHFDLNIIARKIIRVYEKVLN